MNQSRRLLHQMVRPFSPEEECCAARLRLALQMMDAGLEMMRLSLQRAHPEEGPEKIKARLVHWVNDQPTGPGFRDGSHRLRIGS